LKIKEIVRVICAAFSTTCTDSCKNNRLTIVFLSSIRHILKTNPQIGSTRVNFRMVCMGLYNNKPMNIHFFSYSWFPGGFKIKPKGKKARF
jgi:hypothetical protein